VLFDTMYSAEVALFKPSDAKLSRMDINVGYIEPDGLELYSFAGRLHAVAILHHKVFDASFLAAIYDGLDEYSGKGTTTRITNSPRYFVPFLKVTCLLTTASMLSYPSGIGLNSSGVLLQ